MTRERVTASGFVDYVVASWREGGRYYWACAADGVLLGSAFAFASAGWGAW